MINIVRRSRGETVIDVVIFNENGYEETPLVGKIKIGRYEILKNKEAVVLNDNNFFSFIDLDQLNCFEEGIRYICFDHKAHVYRRRETMWIGRTGKDMRIPSVTFDLYIEENTMYIKRYAKGRNELYRNGKVIEEEQVTITPGDVVIFQTLRVTFLEEYMEIKGQQEQYQTQLEEVREIKNYFEGFPYYHRSPRLIKRIKEETIEIQKPPTKSTISKESLLQIIISPLIMLVITILISALLHQGIYILMSGSMTAVTLVMSIQRFFSERKEVKEKNTQREKVYENYLLGIRKQARKSLEEEQAAMSYQNPKMNQIDEMIEKYSSRIYERSNLDCDFLEVNLGYRMTSPKMRVWFNYSEIQLEEDSLVDDAREITKEYACIQDVPVTVDLKKGHLGLVGEREYIHEQLRYIISRITFFQSYHDVEIILIHDKEYKEEFSYLRWYPHFRLKNINVTGVINDDRARDQILGTFHQILKERKLRTKESQEDYQFAPYYLFIIDAPRFIINHPIMEYLQEPESKLGFSMIYTSNQRANLPENIKTVCMIEDSDTGTLLLKEGELVEIKFRLEHNSSVNLDTSARNLAALIHERGMQSHIPKSITFFDMYHIRHPEELEVLERWSKHEAHKSLAVPLGVRAVEDYVELNLHEKAHGPHGLVAGTTGSGKSEIVQSYILSLAANFHPNEVGFLLIDYKGGGMASLFQDLPHLLGIITNLDGTESQRAMASIKSELARRQRLFSENNVNHINGYSKLFQLHKVEEPIPHLFIISDEFAELKKEQPEFMTELVSAARIGRSLGVHLILATQKPTGIVDDQIWTNSKFKLCLKVQNEADSREILRTSDAAKITLPGRSYLQVGNNEIYELFQSAFSGATYVESEEENKIDDRVYVLNELGQGVLINQDLSGTIEENQIKKTQLDVVVEYIHRVFVQSGAKPVRKPWLPSLSQKIVSPYLNEIVDVKDFKEIDLKVKLGMVDIPEQQLQREYEVDYIENGHFLYIASSGYGKTMILSTMILSLAMKNAVANLNFYILDYGNSGLIPFSSLPHTADYITLDDDEKLGKFFTMILEEIQERKRMLARCMAQNYEVFNHSQEKKMKAIMIVVDNFDVVRELGYDAEDFFQKVSRDGASLGIFLIITATRMNGMRYATFNNFKVRIAGYNFEQCEAREIVGKSEYDLPEVKGRALVKLENVNLMQIYVPLEYENDVEYSQKIKEKVEALTQLCSESKAIGIPVLPDTLEYMDFCTFPGFIEDKTKAPIGIDVEVLNVEYLDLTEAFLLIIGASGTGRTNTLKNILEVIQDERMYLVDDSSLELSIYGQKENITYITEEEQVREMIEELRQFIQQREDDFRLEKINNPSLLPKEYYSSLEKLYIVIDGFQEFISMVEGLSYGEDEAENLLINSGNYGITMIVATNNRIRGVNNLATFAKDAKNGVALGDIHNQSAFDSSGIRETNTQVEMGYLVNKGTITKVMLGKCR